MIAILTSILALVVTIGIEMLLWNTVITAIFTLPLVTFWQMAGIHILCRGLFGYVYRGTESEHK